MEPESEIWDSGHEEFWSGEDHRDIVIDREVEKQETEMKDAIGYVSWENRYVLAKPGFEDRLMQELDAEVGSGEIWVAQHPTQGIVRLNFRLWTGSNADNERDPTHDPLPPYPGDNRFYVSALCNKSIAKKITGCVQSGSSSYKDSIVGHKQCNRLIPLPGDPEFDPPPVCSETYQRLGTRWWYEDSICAVDSTTRPHFGWACSITND